MLFITESNSTKISSQGFMPNGCTNRITGAVDNLPDRLVRSVRWYVPEGTTLHDTMSRVNGKRDLNKKISFCGGLVNRFSYT